MVKSPLQIPYERACLQPQSPHNQSQLATFADQTNSFTIIFGLKIIFEIIEFDIKQADSAL